MLFQVVDDILDGDGFVVTLGVDGARRLADDAAERARSALERVDADTSVLARDRRRPRRPHGLSDIPGDWFDGYFEEEWLDEIALHIPEERTRKEVDFVLERLELEPGARVLDIACGHGRHSLELARRGFRVTGVDLSPRSIELAREAAASEGLDDATFVERDARELDFDGGVRRARSTSSRACSATSTRRRRTGASSKRVARALRPGGSFLVDTINLLSLARGFQELHWEEFTSGTLMVEHRAFDFERGRSLADWMFVSRDGSRKTIRHSLRVYAPHELIAMFEAAGLDVVGRWGNFDGDEISFDAWRLILRGVKRARLVG